MKKRMVILTKSDKHCAYCVAGRDIDTGEWLRLVNGQGVITSKDLMTKENYECKELDIVEVECFDLESEIEHQPENVLIHPESYIKKIGQMTWGEVISKWGLEKSNTVLGIRQPEDGSPSIEISRRLEYYEKHNIKHKSLAMIKANNLNFKFNEYNGEPKRHSKVYFEYHNNSGETLCYKLTATDPNFPNDYSIDGLHLDNAYIIVSLGEIFKEDGRVYLLAAKIITTE